MTIIAIDFISDKVYVDSRRTFEYGRPPYDATKLILYPNGAVGAATGNAWVTELVTHHVCDAIDKNVPAAIDFQFNGEQGDGSEGIVRAPNGTIWAWYVSGNKLQIGVQPKCGAYYATGSGADWLNAYIADGCTVLEAITKVARHHSTCGGRIDSF